MASPCLARSSRHSTTPTVQAPPLLPNPASPPPEAIKVERREASGSSSALYSSHTSLFHIFIYPSVVPPYFDLFPWTFVAFHSCVCVLPVSVCPGTFAVPPSFTLCFTCENSPPQSNQILSLLSVFMLVLHSPPGNSPHPITVPLLIRHRRPEKAIDKHAATYAATTLRPVSQSQYCWCCRSPSLFVWFVAALDGG